MSDVADVRQRLQRMIEQARQEAAERRRRAEEDAGTATEEGEDEKPAAISFAGINRCFVFESAHCVSFSFFN